MANKNAEPSSHPWNQETLEAFEEVERMKADSTFGKTYDNVDEMMKDLLGGTDPTATED